MQKNDGKRLPYPENFSKEFCFPGGLKKEQQNMLEHLVSGTSIKYQEWFRNRYICGMTEKEMLKNGTYTLEEINLLGRGFGTYIRRKSVYKLILKGMADGYEPKLETRDMLIDLPAPVHLLSVLFRANYQYVDEIIDLMMAYEDWDLCVYGLGKHSRMILYKILTDMGYMEDFEKKLENKKAGIKNGLLAMHQQRGDDLTTIDLEKETRRVLGNEYMRKFSESDDFTYVNIARNKLL